jgi:GGDEF domain-containing protein
MFELTIRLIGAGLVTFLTGMLDDSIFQFTWRVALVFGAYSIVGYQLENKNLKNPGIAGFIAVADSLAISLILALFNRLDDFGFLTLLPCAYAATRFGSMAVAMAPLAATGLISAEMVVQGKPPTAMLMAHAGAVLLIGLLMNQQRIIVTTTRDVEVPEPRAVETPDAYMELREGYRNLKTVCRELEVSGRRDHLCCQLYETKLSKDERFYTRLTRKLKDLLKVDVVSLYTMAQFDDTMVVRSIAGSTTQPMNDSSIAVNLRLSQAQMHDRIDQALSTIAGPERRLTIANVILTQNGKIIGMLVLQDENLLKLEEGKKSAEEISGFVTSMIVDEMIRANHERRLRESELLYEMAVTCSGADTANNLAARITREVFHDLDVDHMAVWWIDDNESLIAAHAGENLRFVDIMSFANGTGLEGWLSINAPELAIFDVAKDDRCPADKALRLRIGSFCLVPIQFRERPYGYITAATHRTGGIDNQEVETLRIVAAEMGQALARLNNDSEAREGLMTPSEFKQHVHESHSGCIVVLEVLRKEQLIHSFGRPVVEHAQRQLALRLRAKLPVGGSLCRRSQGDFVAFLPKYTEEFARRWANEVSATASLIGLRTPDGKARIPFAIRAKAATVQKNPQIIEEVTV